MPTVEMAKAKKSRNPAPSPTDALRRMRQRMRTFARRDMLAGRKRQTAWLMDLRIKMEDRLAELDLPRDSWRGLSLGRNYDKPHLQDLKLAIQGGPTIREEPPGVEHELPWHGRQFYELIRDAPGSDRAIDAYWAAAIARICDAAMASTDPEEHFIFGRYLDRYQLFLEFEAVEHAVEKRAHVRMGKTRAEEYMQSVGPLHDLIRRTADKLQSQRGLTRHGAAVHIYQNESIQTLVRNALGKRYSLPNVRRIIGDARRP